MTIFIGLAYGVYGIGVLKLIVHPSVAPTELQASLTLINLANYNCIPVLGGYYGLVVVRRVSRHFIVLMMT